MSFPKYPAYKDSGVAWLGEVPGHWEVQRALLAAAQKCNGPAAAGPFACPGWAFQRL